MGEHDLESGGESHQDQGGNGCWESFLALRRTTQVAIVVFFVWFVVMLAVIGSSDRGIGIALVAALIPLILVVPLRYIYLRLFKPFTLDVNTPQVEGIVEEKRGWSRADVVATALFFCLGVVAFVPLMLVESVAGEEPLGFMVFGYNLFGSLVFLLLALTIVDFVDIMKGFVLYRNYSKKVETKDKPFLSFFYLEETPRGQRIKAFVAMLIYLTILIPTLISSYSEPVVVVKDISLSRLPSCMDGFKICVVSDVHAGILVGKTEVAKLVEQVNALEPDVIVLVGDFADGSPLTAGKATVPFANLQAKAGVYYVVGNHEYLHGSDGPAWMDFFSNLGVVPLDNNRTIIGANITTGCEGAILVGVDDFGMGEPDLNAALKGRDESLATILLAHQPRESKNAEEENVDLQISGHIHAGQMFPISTITWLVEPQFAGLNEQGDTLVYVSSGAFGWGPRTRLASRNEIDLLTLKSGPRIAEEDLTIHYSEVVAIVGVPYAIILALFACFCGRKTCCGLKKGDKIHGNTKH